MTEDQKNCFFSALLLKSLNLSIKNILHFIEFGVFIHILTVHSLWSLDKQSFLVNQTKWYNNFKIKSQRKGRVSSKLCFCDWICSKSSQSCLYLVSMNQSQQWNRILTDWCGKIQHPCWRKIMQDLHNISNLHVKIKSTFFFCCYCKQRRIYR